MLCVDYVFASARKEMHSLVRFKVDCVFASARKEMHSLVRFKVDCVFASARKEMHSLVRFKVHSSIIIVYLITFKGNFIDLALIRDNTRINTTTNRWQ